MSVQGRVESVALAGTGVRRSQPTNDRAFDPRAFYVYGPKVIAMRHSFEAPALESRFLAEEMGMRPLNPAIPLNLPNSLTAEAAALRNRLLGFRIAMLGAVRLTPDCNDPMLTARTNQILAPIMSLISDGRLRAGIRHRMAELERSIATTRSGNPGGLVLEVLLSLAKKGDAFVPIGAIAEAASAKYSKDYDRPLTPRYVGQLIRDKLHL